MLMVYYCGLLATIVPGAAKIIQPPMNADKASASQAQDDALDVQTRVADVEQQGRLAGPLREGS